MRYGLMSGLFVPGQVLSLRKLAAEFGTSPMPIRECVGRLLAANALEEMPNGSIRIPLLDLDSIKDLFELRVRVEGMAVRNATPKVTATVLQQLGVLNQKIRQAHDAGAMGRLLAANQEFHFHLYSLTESTILLQIIEGLWLRSGPTMYFALGTPGLWDSSSHVDILDALRRGDAKQAEEAMARDIMKTGSELIHQVQNGVTTGPNATVLLSSFISRERA